LEGNPLDDESVQRLIASPHLTRLTRLVLIDSAVGSGAIQALAASPCRETLTSLDLSWNYFRDEGVATLAAVPWPRLARLGLEHTEMSRAGAEALASSPQLPGLTQLDVSANDLGQAGAVLAASTALERLTALALEQTGLADAGAERLAASPRSARLRKL